MEVKVGGESAGRYLEEQNEEEKKIYDERNCGRKRERKRIGHVGDEVPEGKGAEDDAREGVMRRERQEDEYRGGENRKYKKQCARQEEVQS